MSKVLRLLGWSGASFVAACFILIHPGLTLEASAATRSTQRLEFKNHSSYHRCGMAQKSAPCRGAKSKTQRPPASASLWRRAFKYAHDKWHGTQKLGPKGASPKPRGDALAPSSDELAARTPPEGDAFYEETNGLFKSLNQEALDDLPTFGRDNEILKLQGNLNNRDVIYLTGDSPHDRRALLNGLLQSLDSQKKSLSENSELKNLDNLRVASLDTSRTEFQDLGDLRVSLDKVFDQLNEGENLVLHLNNMRSFLPSGSSLTSTQANLDLERYISFIQQEFKNKNRSHSKLTLLFEVVSSQVKKLQDLGFKSSSNSAVVRAQPLSDLNAKNVLNSLARRIEKQSQQGAHEVSFSPEVLEFIDKKARRFYGEMGNPGGAHYIMKSVVEQRPIYLNLMDESNTVFGHKIKADLDEAEDLLQRIERALDRAQKSQYKPQFALKRKPELIKKVEALKINLEKDKLYVQQVVRDRETIQKANQLQKDIIQKNPDLSATEQKQLYTKQLNSQELDELAKAQQRRKEITKEDVALFLESESKDSLTNLLASTQQLSIDGKIAKFKKRVFGQRRATELIGAALKKLTRSSPSQSNKPKTVMLFVGPSGVGKTESARAAADVQDLNFIKVDMSTMTSQADVSHITGSAPGYVGSEAPSFASRLQAKPDSIVLIDEFEKAHLHVRNAFLGALDDGTITDTAKNATATFKRSIVIITSNLGQNELRPGMSKKQIVEIMQRNADGHSQVVNEFFTRIDDIVVFQHLGIVEMNKIVFRDLEKFNKSKAHNQLINFVIDVKDQSVLSQYVKDNTAGSGREMEKQFSKVIDQMEDLLDNKAYELPSGELKRLDFQEGDEIAIRIKATKTTKQPRLDDEGQAIMDDEGQIVMDDLINDFQVDFEVSK